MDVTKPRILFFDIESTNLNADFGFIVCISYAWGDGPVKTISIADSPNFKDDPTNDSYVVKTFAEIFNSADVVSSWYGKRFDVPFINTRLLNCKLDPLAPVFHIDCWESARKNLKLHSNRLASVQSFLNLEDSKTSLKPAVWVRAMSGHRPSIKYVVDHCIADIKVLREAYIKLKPFLINTPALRALDPTRQRCPRCDSLKVQRRGMYLTAGRRYHRYQCQDCGSWYKGEWADKKRK